ncbi:Pre-mRNA-splicing factor cwf16 [Basidiobolus ranarum]|uniref:Splicing factor YJU2 n=1 Tax=Basidiobolus ranarum TaxID=34480 RepID=A0ABR2W0Z3_9FUNG
MSERKVLNKYFPPDFDPALIPRRKLPKDKRHTVRLMTPFSMRCDTCGEYFHKGKKFNAKKETVEGETYHSIKIFRFYIRCPRCSAEITFKTDPKNADYVAEHGAKRNFEPWREEEVAGEENKAEREQEEKENPLKALENRTLDSKREMEILDALDEIRTRNAKNERVAVDNILEKLTNSDPIVAARVRAELKDDEVAKAIFNTADGESVKRIVDEEEPDPVELVRAISGFNGPTFTAPVETKRRKVGGSKFGALVMKSSDTSKAVSVKSDPPETKADAAPSSSGLSSLLGAYDSDSGSD